MASPYRPAILSLDALRVVTQCLPHNAVVDGWPSVALLTDVNIGDNLPRGWTAPGFVNNVTSSAARVKGGANVDHWGGAKGYQ